MNHPSLSHLARKVFMPGTLMRERYNAFMDLLHYDNMGLEIIADLQEIRQGHECADWARIVWLIRRAIKATRKMIQAFEIMSPGSARAILQWHHQLAEDLLAACSEPSPPSDPPYVLFLDGHLLDEQLVGGKAAALARVMPHEDIRILPGCVVTSRAWQLFVEHNDLRFRLDRALQSIRPHDQVRMAKLARYMQDLILAGDVPQPVVEALNAGIESCLGAGGGSRLIVRSSAVAEDGSFSFAGQYESVLDVEPENLLHAYKRVLAGKYSPNALFYRIHHGFTDTETPMAVLIQPMIDPLASGVVYTRDPSGSDNDLGIYEVAGRGEHLMDGEQVPQTCLVARDTREVMAKPAGRLEPEAYAQLIETAMRIEEIQGEPQDLEWAFDDQGRLFILQTRPLTGPVKPVCQPSAPSIDVAPFPLDLCRAAAGTAHGPVHILTDCHDLSGVPHGCILVVASLRPELVAVMDRVRGVVAMSGSRACHFAAIAREFGIPVLVGQDVVTCLADQDHITMDGHAARIYPGRVDALVAASTKRFDPEASSVAQRLAQVMDTIGTLHLTDASSRDFDLDHCRSLHDVVRLVHEKAVRTMFALVDRTGRGMGRAKNLESNLPLSMRIVDLGGGLIRNHRRRTVTPSDIRCLPMRKLWKGLASPDIFWDSRMPHMDWEEFDRISAGIFGAKSALLASYAVVSHRYTHVLLRFGYHFSVVDSLLAENSKNTYVNFRFKGGGADREGRLLRLEFIARVLGETGFQVSIKGDRLDAHMNRFSPEKTRKALVRLGRVLAMTRLMDMRLDNPEQIDPLIKEFYSG
ncbi:PEP/pyruvate-binding domain-containing protein [Desulfoplanes formicivorans]|uniref:Phosphoenolpyruvate synthase n=1 Tax=Desulfoplanes formicivorans TaxID=1592317 RepID=A0A194AH42_9BACT|nr:PEP/pyruvate-binding domain-containing protein [Desulfoplanes formicivorans]GAU09402.1 pyruvate, water dikinase [Desulfoplanes formicivorans]